MIEFICLFFPALISCFVFERLIKKNISKRNFLFLYGINTIIINFISFLIKNYILGTGDSLLTNGTDMTVAAASNYLIIVIPISILLGIILSLLCKNLKINFE